MFRQQTDAEGWKILVPHSIATRELHKVQALSQVLGWRYRKAGCASDFLFLLDCPFEEVREALASLLGVYKGRQAGRLLQDVSRCLDVLRTAPLLSPGASGREV